MEPDPSQTRPPRDPLIDPPEAKTSLGRIFRYLEDTLGQGAVSSLLILFALFLLFGIYKCSR